MKLLLNNNVEVVLETGSKLLFVTNVISNLSISNSNSSESLSLINTYYNCNTRSSDKHYSLNKILELSLAKKQDDLHLIFEDIIKENITSYHVISVGGLAPLTIEKIIKNLFLKENDSSLLLILPWMSYSEYFEINSSIVKDVSQLTYKEKLNFKVN